MAHGHYRHSRIGKIHSTRHRREIAQQDGGSGSGLVMEGDFLDTPTLPASDELSKDCDPSQDPICLEHRMNESEPWLEKREETSASDITVVETVLQVVDASSHVLLQSTATDTPITISDSAYGTFTISGSESPGVTASLAVTASVDIPSLTSPTLAPATQSTTSLLSETSLSAITTNFTESTMTPTMQTSSSIRVASAISSSARMSTPLVAPSSSTHTASTNSPHAYNYFSDSSPTSSSSSSSPTSETYTESYTSSTSSAFWSSEQTPTATATNSAPSSSTSGTQSSGQGSSSNSDTPKIVGGVVGSVAGLALIILLLFYYLRRRGFFMGTKGHNAISDDAAAGAGIGALAGAASREVVERPGNENRFTASYFAPAFMKRWRQSTATMRTDSTVDSTSSERGFQKISGRKLPPVLTHGGDGFGGGLDGDSPTVPGFLPTSPGAGPIGSPSYAAPPPTSPYGMPLDSNYTREIEERPSPSRPGPAHLPVSSSVNVAHPITITPAHDIAQPQSAIPFIPPRPDGLGRSLHSYDGSRSSRFTEGIDL